MCRYKVGCDLPGKYRVALDSDAWDFGGQGRVKLFFYPAFLHFHYFAIILLGGGEEDSRSEMA